MIIIIKMTEEQEIEFIIEEDNDLTMYSYISNYFCFEYFVGYEIATLLGYKNPSQTIINTVSKCNQLLFKDFPGIKIPELNPKTILITSDGVIEILLKTRKRISPDVLHILKKFNIETTNRKCLTKEQQTLSSIANVFKTEKFEDQYKIGKYYLDLYFSEHKIVIECDENGHADRKPHNERERMDFVNKQLYIDDSHWIRYNPDEYDFDISKVIGQIYRKIDDIKQELNKKKLEELPEKDENSLHIYSCTNDNITVEYFSSIDLAKMLNYKRTTSINDFVSKSNKIKFIDFKGDKNPVIDKNSTLITRQGIVEIFLRTQKKLTPTILKILKKHNYEINVKYNKVYIKDLKHVENKDEYNIENNDVTDFENKDKINIDNAIEILENIEQEDIDESPPHLIFINNNKTNKKKCTNCLIELPLYKFYLKNVVVNEEDFNLNNEEENEKYKELKYRSHCKKCYNKETQLLREKVKNNPNYSKNHCVKCDTLLKLDMFYKNEDETSFDLCINCYKTENNLDNCKQCNKCRNILSFSKFQLDSSHKDGHRSQCKDCRNKQAVNSRQKRLSENDEKVMCEFCNKIISNKNNLNIHQKTKTCMEKQ